MFTGCGTALVTPFARDFTLDEEALRRLVRRHGPRTSLGDARRAIASDRRAGRGLGAGRMCLDRQRNSPRSCQRGDVRPCMVD